MNPERTAIVINPAAGRRDGDLGVLRERFGDAMPRLVYESSPERDVDACARAALAEGAETILAAGGDGTVSLVASALVGTSATLGVLPLGTSNSIAEALGLPGDLDAALAVMRECAPRRIDTARANGRTMVLTASLGVYADTIGSTDRESKNRWGLLAYIATAVEKLLSIEPFEVEIEAEGQRFRCEAAAVTVANLAPRRCVFAQGPRCVDPEDGLLDVTIVSARGFAEALAVGVHLFRTAGREPASRDDVAFFSTRALKVSAAPPQRMIVDGEDVEDAARTVECLPASLAVLAPAPAREGG